MVCSFLILPFIYFLLSVLFVRAKQALTFAVCIGEPSAEAVGYILYTTGRERKSIEVLAVL